MRRTCEPSGEQEVSVSHHLSPNPPSALLHQNEPPHTATLSLFSVSRPLTTPCLLELSRSFGQGLIGVTPRILHAGFDDTGCCFPVNLSRLLHHPASSYRKGAETALSRLHMAGHLSKLEASLESLQPLTGKPTPNPNLLSGRELVEMTPSPATTRRLKTNKRHLHLLGGWNVRPSTLTHLPNRHPLGKTKNHSRCSQPVPPNVFNRDHPPPPWIRPKTRPMPQSFNATPLLHCN